MNLQHPFKYRTKFGQRHHIRTITWTGIRIWMRFKEYAIHTYSGCGTREWLNQSSITTSGIAMTRRPLNRMCGIEQHGNSKRSHRQQASEIINQSPIPKECTSLTQQCILATTSSQFRNRMLHLRRRHKLALFHIHCPTRAGRRQKQVRLPTEKRRDLKHVTDFCNRFSLLRQMNICCYW